MRLRVLARQLEMSLTEEALCAEPYGQAGGTLTTWDMWMKLAIQALVCGSVMSGLDSLDIPLLINT